MKRTLIQAAAQAAHEVNRAYCAALGDFSQLPWDHAPEWQRTSAMNGVVGVIHGNDPRASHETWLQEKISTGWKYGPVKDPEKKEHPCMVPYDDLPPDQKRKDHLFVSTVKSVIDALRPWNYAIVRVFHADHGVSEALMKWALGEIQPTGFFCETVEIPEGEPDLLNNLYGPASGDAPVKGDVQIRDTSDAFRQATPFVDLPPRPTRKLTVIGNLDKDGGAIIFTAYGGPAAERIPSDPSLENDPKGRAKAEAFWAEHALSVAAKKGA